MKCYKIKINNQNIITEGRNILEALGSASDFPISEMSSISEMK